MNAATEDHATTAAETARLAAETAHLAAEIARRAVKTDHRAAEIDRRAAETDRRAAETDRLVGMAATATGRHRPTAATAAGGASLLPPAPSKGRWHRPSRAAAVRALTLAKLEAEC